MAVSNIQQFYTLYDVTGLIDKSKRLYFVPHKNRLTYGVPLCESFVVALNNVCPPPSLDYRNVEISRWNPQDRELVVEGNIDAFTKGSSSHVFNYVIIKRIVDNKTFYDGFFITSALQSGINSVKLSLEPDHFTNVFYLHNTKDLVSIDYEPFNELMKNCYVERQHYNRVDVVNEPLTFTDIEAGSHYETGKLYSINKSGHFNALIPDFYVNVYQINAKGEKALIGVANRISYVVDINPPHTNIIRIQNRVDNVSTTIYQIRVTEYYNSDFYIAFELVEAPAEPIEVINRSHIKVLSISQQISVANSEIHLTQNETFKYKYQKKISKKPLVISKSYDSEHDLFDEVPDECFGMTTQQAEEYLLTATSYQRHVIANACIGYIHILCKDRITYPTIIKGTGDSPNVKLQGFYDTDMEFGGTISSPQQHLVIPFIKLVKGLESFYALFNSAKIHIDAYNTNRSSTTGIFNYNNMDIANVLGVLQERYGYYIQSIYVTPYSELSRGMDVGSAGASYNYGIRFRGDLFKGAVPSEYAPTSAGTLGDNYTTIQKYDSRCVTRPTIVLLSKNKINTTFGIGSKSSASQNEVLDAIINGIDYWLETFQRKNIHASEKFMGTPHEAFESGTIVQNQDGSYSYSSVVPNFSDVIMMPAFIVGTKGFEDYMAYDYKETINPTNLKTTFYEPSLNVEPYSLLTMSFLETETSLQKKRLLLQYTYTIGLSGAVTTHSYLHFVYNQNVNANFKFGMIPSYAVDNYIRNYNDSLVYISADSLIIRNNSYYDYTYQQNARMNAERYLTSLNGAIDIASYVVNDVPYNIGSGVLQSGWKGAIEGAGRSMRDVGNQVIDYAKNIYNVKVMQEAELAGAGAKADTYQCAGSDLIYDLKNNEFILYINRYKIDDLSYNTNSKILERFGYKVDLFDKLHTEDRMGWNYLKLISFDFAETSTTLKLSDVQQESIRDIFLGGVTLVHNASYINEEKHNYETILGE